MSKHYIFTKQFFNLPPADQAAVVDAALHDLESAIRGLHPEQDRLIRQVIRRIEKKAVEYGVYDGETDVA